MTRSARSAHDNGDCDWPCIHCMAEDAEADARAQSRYEMSLEDGEVAS